MNHRVAAAMPESERAFQVVWVELASSSIGGRIRVGWRSVPVGCVTS